MCLSHGEEAKPNPRGKERKRTEEQRRGRSGKEERKRKRGKGREDKKRRKGREEKEARKRREEPVRTHMCTRGAHTAAAAALHEALEQPPQFVRLRSCRCGT